MSTLSKENIAELNDISIHESLNTHKHGKEYHHCVAEIGYKVNSGLQQHEYHHAQTCSLTDCAVIPKILKIGTRELYAFIINNEHLLVEDVRDAMADESLAAVFGNTENNGEAYRISAGNDFHSMTELRSHKSEFSKNVYKGYLSSAENAFLARKTF